MASYYVSSLAKGLDVLQAFSRERPELTLSEVAAATGITPAAARRALLTLRDLGFVTSHKRSFLLTPRVLRLSGAYLSSVNMQAVLQQYLQEASDATGDSASVAVLDGTEVLYVASVPVKRSYQLTPSIGTRYPAYCTALGRALLAWSPESVVERALSEDLTKLTAKTQTDPTALRALFAGFRETGIAGAEDELAYGVVSVAMPILDQSGHAIAAVNCSTTPARTDLAQMYESRYEVLERTRAQINSALLDNPVLLHSVLGAYDT